MTILMSWCVPPLCARSRPCPVNAFFAALRDESSFVHRAVLDRVLTGESAENPAQSITILLEEGFSSNLTDACRQSSAATQILFVALGAENLARKPTHAGLEAIAAT